MDVDRWHYVDTLSKCCSRYPDLLQLRDFLEKEGEKEKEKEKNCGPAVPRAAVLEFRGGKVERKSFNNAEELQGYFQVSKDPGCKGRLFMLEDLSKPYVEAFGSHFWIDPFLFASQERSNWVSWDNPSLGMTYRLPSAQMQSSIFTLRYYEMGRFEGKGNLPYDTRCHSNLDRIIDKEKFAEDRVFSVKRNASFWSRTDKDGWNGQFQHVITLDSLIPTHRETLLIDLFSPPLARAASRRNDSLQGRRRRGLEIQGNAKQTIPGRLC